MILIHVLRPVFGLVASFPFTWIWNSMYVPGSNWFLVAMTVYFIPVYWIYQASTDKYIYMYQQKTNP